MKSQTIVHWNMLSDAISTYPAIPTINGFWSPVPVIVALKHGRVVGAFATREGGDAMDEPGEKRMPIPVFETDEGLPYTDVVAWASMPEHPCPPPRVKTYA